jgi:NAD(P)-dependent dehydrogenase (short-subunit alcohol dehydrogenase family)
MRVSHACPVCDICDTDELAAAYARHHDVFGQLHICINNAGIYSTKLFYEDDAWRKMLDTNLTAVIDGTGKAVMTFSYPSFFLSAFIWYSKISWSCTIFTSTRFMC